MRQPITSSTRPDLPWPTPTMRSPGFSVPSTAAGPPAMISRITTTSSWRCSCAPMPSSDSDIAWLKFSAVRGLIDRLLQRGIALVQRLADIVRLLAGQLQAQHDPA
ncbi:hypothetical protein G6F64_014743 [Rhizopus arrhizus]|uniref:Uncharacterized protein n=1 Tax=Rhizopus oryzae TaxID=64495 RepID=A0A9P6WTM6_RHIOR|nr:hypothetical protein G6F64_014743 [Rhizopus arrhizus]